jgi:hypothetical protein
MWPFWIILFPSISDIPITANGKLHIPDLVDKCRTFLGNIKTKHEQTDIKDVVVQIWKQALPNLGNGNFTNLMSQHFLTLGGSSLSVMWCVEKIMQETGMYLP